MKKIFRKEECNSKEALHLFLRLLLLYNGKDVEKEAPKERLNKLEKLAIKSVDRIPELVLWFLCSSSNQNDSDDPLVEWLEPSREIVENFFEATVIRALGNLARLTRVPYKLSSVRLPKKDEEEHSNSRRRLESFKGKEYRTVENHKTTEDEVSGYPIYYIEDKDCYNSYSFETLSGTLFNYFVKCEFDRFQHFCQTTSNAYEFFKFLFPKSKQNKEKEELIHVKRFSSFLRSIEKSFLNKSKEKKEDFSFWRLIETCVQGKECVQQYDDEKSDFWGIGSRERGKFTDGSLLWRELNAGLGTSETKQTGDSANVEESRGKDDEGKSTYNQILEEALNSWLEDEKTKGGDSVNEVEAREKDDRGKSTLDPILLKELIKKGVFKPILWEELNRKGVLRTRSVVSLVCAECGGKMRLGRPLRVVENGAQDEAVPLVDVLSNEDRTEAIGYNWYWSHTPDCGCGSKVPVRKFLVRYDERLYFPCMCKDEPFRQIQCVECKTCSDEYQRYKQDGKCVSPTRSERTCFFCNQPIEDCRERTVSAPMCGDIPRDENLNAESKLNVWACKFGQNYYENNFINDDTIKDVLDR